MFEILLLREKIYIEHPKQSVANQNNTLSVKNKAFLLLTRTKMKNLQNENSDLQDSRLDIELAETTELRCGSMAFDELLNRQLSCRWTVSCGFLCRFSSRCFGFGFANNRKRFEEKKSLVG